MWITIVLLWNDTTSHVKWKKICIKGEGEGIFYNCTDHAPDGKKAKSYFVERMERNDPFSKDSVSH